MRLPAHWRFPLAALFETAETDRGFLMLERHRVNQASIRASCFLFLRPRFKSSNCCCGAFHLESSSAIGRKDTHCSSFASTKHFGPNLLMRTPSYSAGRAFNLFDVREDVAPLVDETRPTAAYSPMRQRSVVPL